jgi:hypothetical protein
VQVVCNQMNEVSAASCSGRRHMHTSDWRMHAMALGIAMHESLCTARDADHVPTSN